MSRSQPNDLRVTLDLRAEAHLSDELLLSDEQEAVRSFFDEINTRRLRFNLWLLVSAFALYAVFSFADGRMAQGGTTSAAVVACALLLHLRQRRFVVDSIRQVCAGCLLGASVLMCVIHGTDTSGAALWFVILAVLAGRLRFSPGEHLALIGSLYAIFVVRSVIVEQLLLRRGLPVAELLSVAFLGLVLVAAAAGSAQRAKKRFLARWRVESLRHRDRLRMKQELEYARQIQLSMLPRQAPTPSWLDIAALSIPATEVGGDYYDYFPLGGERLAVVVGDVTGHGVASGLVLSGVRASLNLLQEEMDAPQQILGRVNRMLKRTATPRMLMTLGLAVLDGSSSTLTLSTAGHPPALLARQGGDDVEEIGRGALPLGAMARSEYAEDRLRLEAGDVLLLYSDGLVETTDPEGRQFGWDRLRQALRAAAGETSAQAVRDALLRELWDFKGDAEQVDDVTMVVIRVRPA